MIYICPICNKNKDGIQNTYHMTTKGPVHDNKWKLNKRPCKTCKELMKESVILTCSKCDSMTYVNEQMFVDKGINIRNGDIFEIKECPKCSDEKKFIFL